MVAHVCTRLLIRGTSLLLLRAAIGVALFGIAQLSLFASPLAAADFPYTAYVDADEAEIRSGPGDSYYTTSRLPRGTTLEVYRHDPGGWYAVRPPVGSFSWVPAEAIEPLDGDWGRVVSQRSVARVGSDLSDIRDVIQVRLDLDEEVEILGAEQFGSGPSAKTWYRIAPPAGEFRWIFGRDVVKATDTDRDAARDTARDPARDDVPQDERRSRHHLTADEASPDDAPSGSDDEDNDDNEADDDADRSARQRRIAERTGRVKPPWGSDDYSPPPRVRLGPTISEEQIDDEGIADEGNARDPRGDRHARDRQVAGGHAEDHLDGVELNGTAEESIDLDRDRERVAARNRVREVEEIGAAVPQGRPWSADRIAEELREIDLDLASLLGEEPTAWDFEKLRSKSETVLSHSSTALERGRARAMLAKIERFDEVGRRSRALAQLQNSRQRQARTAGRTTETTASRPQDAAPTNIAAQKELGLVQGRFDGIGKLTPVVSRQAGSPYFALLDENGSVRCYVTPAPGVNLRHYVGRQVGLNGQMGYAADLKSQHVTAQRVTVLDQVQLR